MEKILDFSQPLNIDLFDKVTDVFYSQINPQEVNIVIV
jgi:hypothetical protein